jgi:hypothetical protein
MMDRKRAFQILGLPEGSPLDRAQEAYRKLADQWRPERINEDPALRAEAVHKLQLLKEALNVIRLEAGAASDRSNLYGQIYGGRKPKREGPPARQGDKPSLLDETFSRSGARPGIFLIFGIAAAVAFGLLLLILFPRAERAVEAEPALEGARQAELDLEAELVPLPEEPASDDAPNQADARVETPVRGVPATAAAPPEEPRRPSQPERLEGDRPRLIRDEIAGTAVSRSPGIQPTQEAEPQRAGSAPSTPEAETITAEPPEPDPEAEAAFQFLKDGAESALRLHAGLLDDLEFMHWQVVSRSGSNWMIGLSARNQETGREEQFVWSVDTERRQVRALSQAARDLEGRFPRAQ